MVIDAIVIKKTPLREHDQVVTLYSAQLGKCAAVARSSLRTSSTQALALDDGNMIRCELVPGRSELPIMTGAQSQRCWAHAKMSPTHWAVAHVLFQVVQWIVYDHQPDDRLWELTARTLSALDAHEAPLSVLRAMQCSLLESLGYGAHTAEEAATQRNHLDDQFDRIAQRHLTATDTFYQLARMYPSVVQ